MSTWPHLQDLGTGKLANSSALSFVSIVSSSYDLHVIAFYCMSRAMPHTHGAHTHTATKNNYMSPLTYHKMTTYINSITRGPFVIKPK